MRARGLALWVMMATLALAACSVGRSSHPGAPGECQRPPVGSEIPVPLDLYSEQGVLLVDLSMRSLDQADGKQRYCYVLKNGAQAPTLRLHAGDVLILHLKNQLRAEHRATVPSKPAHAMHTDPRSAASCAAGSMTLTSTNLHFHGLQIAATCHQDDTLHTSIAADALPFEYRFRIPADQPPGMYWYHPHLHGLTAPQVLGGASGALIIEGIEQAQPAVAGIAERVLVIRDQDLVHPEVSPPAANSAPKQIFDRDGDAGNNGTGAGRPAKDISINYVAVPYPDYPPAVIRVKPEQPELWRVLNASSVTYLNLSVQFKRNKLFRPQPLDVMAIDGVPIDVGVKSGHPYNWGYTYLLPPGGRVEFVMHAPPAGIPGRLVTTAVDTGVGGENDPTRTLARVESAADAAVPPLLPRSRAASLPVVWAPVAGTRPVRTRRLYFSEVYENPADPNSNTTFFLTEEGASPTTFDPMSDAPNIVVKHGDIEDWIIENRSTELHAFHIHQLHFQVLERSGLPVNELFLRDTVNVPFYTEGMKAYPSVQLRMDFGGANVVGTFMYHCHLLDHEDGGMMGLIRVEPAQN